MAPGSLSYYIASLSIISHLIYYFSIFTFQSIQKSTKNIYFTISIRSHFCEWPWRDWQPLYRVGCKVLDCLCRYSVTCVSSPTGLITWFSKTEGNTYATLLHHTFLFKGKPMHAQEVARRISCAVAGEIYAQVKTYQVPITNSSPSHYIICHLPLVFLSPTSPLPFYSPFFGSSFRLLWCLTWLVCSFGWNSCLFIAKQRT